MRAKISEFIQSGVTLLCPKCRAKLLVALDIESVREHQVHPGIYCSQTPEHFFEMHELRHTDSVQSENDVTNDETDSDCGKLNNR